MKYKILYVDDEKINLNTFRALMRKEYEVHLALSGMEALDILEKRKNRPHPYRSAYAANDRRGAIGKSTSRVPRNNKDGRYGVQRYAGHYQCH